MPPSSTHDPLNLRLWYGDVLVADLLDVIPHQGTWFAEYRQIVAAQSGPTARRLCEYIQFCEEWHERLDRGESPDPNEFDAFTDLVKSVLWRVPCPDGSELRAEGAPIFMHGEVSWNHPEAEPSTERAAHEIWTRLQNQKSGSEYMTQPKKIIAGIAWFRADQWELLRSLADDVEKLEATHAEWVVIAEKAIKDFESRGVETRKVLVDVDVLKEWCAVKNRPLNAAARADYAFEILTTNEETDETRRE